MKTQSLNAFGNATYKMKQLRQLAAADIEKRDGIAQRYYAAHAEWMQFAREAALNEKQRMESALNFTLTTAEIQ